MYMYSNFIVQQTLPSRIHPPGSICLRHLGELLPIFSFCSCLRGIEKYKFESVNSKIPAVIICKKEKDDSDVCLFRVLSLGRGWDGWNRSGGSWDSAKQRSDHRSVA